jgi:hypothetical protein
MQDAIETPNGPPRDTEGRRFCLYQDAPSPKARRAEWVMPAPGDQQQDVPKHLTRYRDLGQLEADVAAVADDLRADLDQLLALAGQRPCLRRFRHRQHAYEVAEVVSQRMELETHGLAATWLAPTIPRPATSSSGAGSHALPTLNSEHHCRSEI